MPLLLTPIEIYNTKTKHVKTNKHSFRRIAASRGLSTKPQDFFSPKVCYSATHIARCSAKVSSVSLRTSRVVARKYHR